MSRAVGFDTSAALQIDPGRLVVCSVGRWFLDDDFSLEMIVVVIAAGRLRLRRLGRDPLDLFYFFFREQMAETSLSIPNSLRRFPRIINGHVRTVREFQPDLRRLCRGITRGHEHEHK